MLLTIQTTKKDEVIDITDNIEEILSGITAQNGLCTIFVQHTTACVTAADLDPGTDLDLLDALRGILPSIHYRHPHDPSHTPDHILSSLIGPSLTVPFEHKQFQLGVWQRIILIELDGPRKRNIHVMIVPIEH